MFLFALQEFTHIYDEVNSPTRIVFPFLSIPVTVSLAAFVSVNDSCFTKTKQSSIARDFFSSWSRACTQLCINVYITCRGLTSLSVVCAGGREGPGSSRIMLLSRT